MAILDNIKAYWQFSESAGNAADSSGNSYTLTNAGITYSPGKINNCAVIGADGGTYNFSNSSLASYTPTDFTLNCWVYRTAGVQNDPSCIVRFQSNDLSILIPGTAGRGGFPQDTVVVENWNGSTTVYKGSTATIPSNTWTMITVVHTSGVFEIHINGGANDCTSGSTTTTWDGADNFFVGALSATNWNFNGKIDELGIWDRVLSSGEIATLYNSGNGYNPITLSAAIASYWKLDESSGNASDSVGSNTLTNSNVTYAAGKINNGAIFNGSSACYTIPSGVYGTFDGTKSFTWAGWVYMDSSGFNYPTIFEAQENNPANFNDFSFAIAHTDTGGDRTQVTRGTGSAVTTTYATAASGITKDAWFHLAVTYNGSKIQIYRNGVNITDGTGADTSTATTATGGFVGKNVQGGTSYAWLKGKLDEVGVWNRALSITEVAELYYNSVGIQYPFTSKTIKLLTVAGGGGGGGTYGAGAGAGGVIYEGTYKIANGNYSVTIGGGGAGGVGAGGSASGSNSLFGVLTAIGGGGGGNTGDSASAGGSGGGSGYTVSTGKAGTNGQGFAGGGGVGNPLYTGGGGGGAGAVGQDAQSGAGGAGGIGLADADVGSLLSMASAPDTDHIAGGGGSGKGDQAAGGAGGNGGGGAGTSTASGGTGTAGTANTGGGGGGGSPDTGTGGAGGSGIVIVAYTTADFSHTGGNATGTSGSETWVKFTADGTLTLTEKAAGSSKFFQLFT